MAEIKLPVSVHYTGSQTGIKDGSGRFLFRKTVNMMSHEQWQQLGVDFKQIVAALNATRREDALVSALVENDCTDEECKNEEDKELAAEYGIPHDSTTCACPCHEMQDKITAAHEALAYKGYKSDDK